MDEPRLDPQSVDRYCRWRQQSIRNTPRQTVSLVYDHGLAHALLLTLPPSPTDRGNTSVPVVPAHALITQASSMSCKLLNTLQAAYVVS